MKKMKTLLFIFSHVLVNNATEKQEMHNARVPYGLNEQQSLNRRTIDKLVYIKEMYSIFFFYCKLIVQIRQQQA